MLANTISQLNLPSPRLLEPETDDFGISCPIDINCLLPNP